MSSQLNFYQVLNLETRQHTESLTAEEVKKAYRRALLQHHPDKQRSEEFRHPLKDSSTIDEITRAFHTLSDPVLRADYDRKIHADEQAPSGRHATRHTGMETIDLDDLDYDEESEIWSRNCRCGNDPAFVVTEAELEKNVEDGELIIGCKGCSLWLKILFSAEG